MIITDDEINGKLKEFVKNGGTLVMTYRTAVKNRDNNLTLGEMTPVGLTELAGVEVEETESLQELEAFPLSGREDCYGKSGSGGIFRDMLITKGAQTLYSYGDRFYMGYAAITKNKFGSGRVYYIGCSPDAGTLKGIIEMAVDEAQIEKLVSPDGVEIVYRGEGENRVRMVINHNDHEVNFGSSTLEAFECRIEK
jgi:beta-galactosidase